MDFQYRRHRSAWALLLCTLTPDPIGFGRGPKAMHMQFAASMTDRRLRPTQAAMVLKLGLQRPVL